MNTSEETAKRMASRILGAFPNVRLPMPEIYLEELTALLTETDAETSEQVVREVIRYRKTIPSPAGVHELITRIRKDEAKKIASDKSHKRNLDYIRNRAKELVENVARETDMSAWPEQRRIRARMHWSRIADMQAQFEDLGHEDPIGATARYYGLDERSMWQPA